MFCGLLTCVIGRLNVQGRLLYKVGGRHWRLRHVELSGRSLRCFQVDEDMLPVRSQVGRS
jgi:hypothetical protein